MIMGVSAGRPSVSLQLCSSTRLSAAQLASPPLSPSPPSSSSSSSSLLPPGRDDMENNHTFMYFAYGSNLLKERLQLKNPSAIVHCVARLKDYKLEFGNYKGLASDRWHGGVATIEHSPGDEVWGVVWRMNMSDLESLDSQENVLLGAYTPVELSVKDKDEDLNCRTYIMNSCVYAPPSPQYLQVMVMGAEQNSLPKNYQKKLRAIKTNMYEGPLPMMAELDRARRAKERDLRDYQDCDMSRNQVLLL
ncbi:gamma-glutamylcyclotransferase b [Notolabrus celidotus]|uniref:gamma-glutamylcyclotransferase b n=1 Tax=Notolabrus celidotus TaxID=1203425 RepID=UPI00148F9967|nr:gamma-glutamylcyclotransferase b [Notolabrus celidotus]